VFGGGAYGVTPVTSLSTDVKVWVCGNQLAQSLSNNWMVVNDEYAVHFQKNRRGQMPLECASMI
jgi:hypothetical protein